MKATLLPMPEPAPWALHQFKYSIVELERHRIKKQVASEVRVALADWLYSLSEPISIAGGGPERQRQDEAEHALEPSPSASISKEK